MLKGMAQEAREHAEEIEMAKRRRENRDFSVNYRGEVAEFEVEEVGSVGEAHGG